MANDVETASDPSVTSLVGGIVNDAQKLMSQQLTLFRSEIQQDLYRSWQAGTVLASGLALGAIAGVLLIFALAHLVNWAWPDCPLWVCYGLVGAVVAVVAGMLVYAGKKQFDSFNPLPDESLQSLQENVQWLTKAPK